MLPLLCGSSDLCLTFIHEELLLPSVWVKCAVLFPLLGFFDFPLHLAACPPCEVLSLCVYVYVCLCVYMHGIVHAC